MLYYCFDLLTFQTRTKALFTLHKCHVTKRLIEREHAYFVYKPWR